MAVRMVPKYIACGGGFHIELEEDTVSFYKYGTHLFTISLKDFNDMSLLVNQAVIKRELDENHKEDSDGKA